MRLILCPPSRLPFATAPAVAIGVEERVQGDVTRQLKPIAQIGSGIPFVDGKSRSWWALQAFLAGDYNEIIKGMKVKDLHASTNKLASARAAQLGSRFEPLGPPEFVGLLSQHWHTEQTRDGQTPVLAFND